MIKAIIAIVILAVFSGVSAFAVKLYTERDQFQKDLAVAESANATLNSEMDRLNSLVAEKEAQIIRRDKFIKSQKAQTQENERELEQAQKELTDKELECLNSSVPAPIIDFMRIKPLSNSSGAKDHQVVSKPSSVLGG
ncbi:MAG: hypothetical protein PVI43_00125 [Candidatus Bathyarchaeota archaeon]|jgi:hypothetical protein